MLDMKFIRLNNDKFLHGLKLRGCEDIGLNLLTVDEKWRGLQVKLDGLRCEKNEIDKKIGLLKRDKIDTSDLMSHANEIAKELNVLESKCENVRSEMNAILINIPNLPDEDVPFGNEEKDNIVVKVFNVDRKFDFTPRMHDEIGAKLGMSISDGVKLSGSRFVVLYGKMARLERALAAFMLDEHRKAGYQEVSVPYIVREEAMYGSGNLPKFREDFFATTRGDCLIPTSEVSLVNLAREYVFDRDDLPWKMTAYTPCFRSEVGSAGKANHGLTRLHQFHKVEMVKIVEPNKSNEAHESMVLNAENILEKLQLPYRRVLLSSQEMGFSARKTYDLEVWLPGENCYREISSCSNCGDFQARRMKSKVVIGDESLYVHTLNGSGLAVGRTMIAILENYQRADGSVLIPNVLLNYLDFDVMECS
ncbi:serine--tRNA ligase [Candidatus Gromoviella agglomerans]|uniref:serine--tRNA ligase n=1 Tax=Candidatus Gromoviella agglomerans TaxID=2806609 RepID=UPI001E4A7A75|nr:serine--tRNA ligase [Candidatus Gromoviella agglomerans]UFX98349.1 Serine--tRNA ligase [Candidatus Gromoviella agglomerans]